MTSKILEFAKVIPKQSWQMLTSDRAYVCRARVREWEGKFLATAIRCPGIEAQGDTPNDAIQRVTEAFRIALECRHAILTPIRDIPAEDMVGAVQRLVWVSLPSVGDIRELYSETELTDEEAEALLTQRASGKARATVPLARYPRQ